MGFLAPSPPKPTPPPPPANAPTKASISVINAGQQESNYSSLIASGSPTGLDRKASTKKRTLIGGS